jgi:hypothetical protein
MFGFVLLSFLLLAVVLAVAVFFAFKSGQAGQTRMSGPAGCMVALALLVIAGIGGLGLLIVGLVNIPNEAVKHGPVKSWEFRWDDEGEGREAPAPDAPRASDERDEVRLTVTLRGLEDPSKVMKWLRKRTDADTKISVREDKDADGKPVTVIELSVDADHELSRDLREVRRDLERDLPDLKLPTGIKVEFRGPDDE